MPTERQRIREEHEDTGWRHLDLPANPHHENIQWALDPDCPWGIPTILKHAFDADGDVTLDEVEVGGVIRLPEDRGIVQRVIAHLSEPDPEDDTNRVRDRLVIDVPWVARTGEVLLDQRDVAPIGFLRLRPGIYVVSDGGPVIPMECPNPPDHDDEIGAPLSGEGADEGHDGEDDREEEPGDDLWQHLLGARPSEHKHILVEPVNGPRVILWRFEPFSPWVVQVDGIGSCEAEVCRSALQGRRSGSTARKLAGYLRHLGAMNPDVAADDLLDPSWCNRTLEDAEARSLGDWMADLDHCRLKLAGHHVAHEIARSASGMSRRLRSDPDEPTSLSERVRDAEGHVNLLLQQLVGGGRRDPDGGIAPFEAIDDTNHLARFEHCRKVSRLGRGGVHPESKTAEQLRDWHPSFLGRLCPFNTPESSRVGLIRYLTLGARIDRDGYFEPGPASVLDDSIPPLERVLSASALFLPSLNHDDAVRAVLATKSIRQFVPLSEPEPPIVRTGFEAALAASLGSFYRAQEDARIDLDASRLRLYRRNTTIAEIPLRNHPFRAAETGTDSSRLVCLDAVPERPRPGQSHTAEVKKGELLFRVPGTVVDRGEVVLAPGVNALCAVMPFRGLTIEDAVVVSESFAARMRSVHVEEILERIAPDEVLDRRITEFVGRSLKAGEELFHVLPTPGREGAEQGEGAKEAAPRRTVCSPFDGVVLEAPRPRPTLTGDRMVRLLVRVERPLAAGDKLTARHGNKGVVSAVLPDEQMPLVKSFAGADNRRADLVISPFGPLRRMVIGLFEELAWGRIAAAAGTHRVVPPLGHQGTDQLEKEVADLARSIGGDGWSAPVELPDGTELPAVAVGVLYVMKLNHLAARKLQSQGWSPPSVRSGQPQRSRLDEQGRRMGRPQRLGEMEFWALQAAGAYRAITDAMGPRRGSRSPVTDTLRVVLDHLHAAGVIAELRLEDGTRVISTDQQALERITDVVRSISFDLFERRRLVMLSAQSPRSICRASPTPLETPASAEEAAERSRRDQVARAPTPPDGRKDRPSKPARDSSASAPDSPGVATSGPGPSELPTRSECGCGPVEEAPGSWCPKCRRVRRKVVSDAARHSLSFLDLSRPVVHPWFTSRFLGACREVAKLDHATYEILERARTCADGEGRDCRCCTWDDDADLPVPTYVRHLRGGPALEFELIARLVTLFESGDTHRALLTKLQGALKFTLTYLPMLPSAQRPNLPRRDGTVHPDPLTNRYRAIAERVEELRGLTDAALLTGAATDSESGTDGAAFDELLVAHRRVAEAVSAALGSSTGAHAGANTIAHRLRFKEGLLRRYLLGASQWRTAYAVMVPDPSLHPDQLALPPSVRSDLGVRDGDVVLLNRNPTLLRTEMLGMTVVESGGDVVAIPPSVIPMLAGDFDGDMVTVHAPIDGRAREEIRRVLHPGANLRSPATGDPLIYCSEELGLDDALLDDLSGAAENLSELLGEDLSGSPVSLDDLRSAARAVAEGYQTAYDALTRRGVSASLGQILKARRDPNDPEVTSWLAMIRAGGLDDTRLEQILAHVGECPTYRSRAGVTDIDEVAGNFLDGLSIEEALLGAAAAIPKLGDKKLSVRTAGDFTKRLVEALYDLTVAAGDCGSQASVRLEELSPRARRRAGIGAERVRSPLSCEWLRSDPATVCQQCYGDNLSTGRLVAPGTRVGLLAAQAIGERGTQLALKAIHAGAGSTRLDRVVEPLLKRVPVPVPESTPQGLLYDPAAGQSTATIFGDALGVVRLYRWVYTTGSQEGVPLPSESLPMVDDIHIELAIASLHANRPSSWTPPKPGDEARGPSPLLAALQRHGPLARATVRGSLGPLLDAATRPNSASGDGWRDRFVLHPTHLHEELDQ